MIANRTKWIAHGRTITVEAPGCEYPLSTMSELLPEDEAFQKCKLMAAAPELMESLCILLRTCQDAARHGWKPCEIDAIQFAVVGAQSAIKKATM